MPPLPAPAVPLSPDFQTGREGLMPQARTSPGPDFGGGGAVRRRAAGGGERNGFEKLPQVVKNREA